MVGYSKIPEDNFKNKTADGAHSESRVPRSKDDLEPCCHLVGGRNLIVCIDGTGNQFGAKNTNVIELYNLILKEDEHKQHTWYNSGIGTYARPSWKSLKYYRKVLYHMIDLAIAWNFEQIVMAAYRWLSDNYRTGDCIYLFGFSRGAFQVRVLSAMIDKVGLIYKGNEMQIPFAYELYADQEGDGPNIVTQIGSPEAQQKLSLSERLKKLIPHKDNNEKAHEDTSMAERFKRAFSHKNVRVHFVGAWDTVSSIGIARGTHMLPRTVDGMKHVCYFRQALALDERRVKFAPEYAFGGSAQARTKSTDGKPPNVNQDSSDKDRQGHNLSTGTKEDGNFSVTYPPTHNDEVHSSKISNTLAESPPHTLEVWFAGTHSDIGGGNAENADMDRSRPPLRWMVFEAGSLGLRTARFDRVLLPSEQVEIKESLTWAWWPLELLCLKRLTYTRKEDGKQTTRKPHFGSSRKIHAGQKIHGSLTLTDQNYTPRARPLGANSSFWLNARTNKLEGWRAVDLYEATHALVERFVDQNDITVWQTLRQTASSGDGRQAVYEGVVGVLKGTKLNPEVSMAVKHQLIANAIDILIESARKDTSLKLCHSVSVRTLLGDLWKSNNTEYREIARQFMEQFVDSGPLEINEHAAWVWAVAFSPNGKCVASGSSDRTVRIWDAGTGRPVGEPLRGHTKMIWSIAFSPDGKCIVSGSDDATVRIWDVETGKPVGKPFQGHKGGVTSVAFSPDGKRVASGSLDKKVRIWDVNRGKLVGEPLQGHTDWVRSVAFSSDGKYIASGSKDAKIRIWHATTGKPAGEPLQGHEGVVRTIAFSPDNRRIVSGSYDSTVQIWDVETGRSIGKLFQGHNAWVKSVAISPDGRHIVSGSDDGTARVWDVEMGKLKTILQHPDGVNAVAFSPDSTFVVSGSDDRRVRIWDIEPLVWTGRGNLIK